jgi:hypothetical protein
MCMMNPNDVCVTDGRDYKCYYWRPCFIYWVDMQVKLSLKAFGNIRYN